jgi:hypothetical protein
MSQHRLFYFMELKEPKAACGLFPSLSWCCYRVEWRPGQKFHDAYRDVGDGVIEVWQDRFVLAADPGGVEYDGGQTDALMAARFKKRRAEAAQGSRGPGARGSVLGGLAYGSLPSGSASIHRQCSASAALSTAQASPWRSR